MNIQIEKVRPVGATMVIEPFTGDEETDSGLILSKETISATPVMGTVIAAGELSKYKKGQIIFFARYSADELKVQQQGDEVKIYIVEDVDVRATYNETQEEKKDPYAAIKEKKELDGTIKDESKLNNNEK